MELYRNKKLIFIFQLIIVIISALSIYLNIKLFHDVSGFLYYTILSNIFCFLFYLIAVVLKIIKKFKKNNIYYFSKGLLLLSMLCTMLMYNFFIGPTGQIGEYINHQLECNLVHILVPILTLFEFILFEDKRVLKYKYLIFWGLTLILYGVIIILYSKLGGLFLGGAKYPYFTFNVSQYGYLKCILINFIIFIAYEFVGFIIIFINNKRKERKI